MRCCRFDGQVDSLNWEARQELSDEQEATAFIAGRHSWRSACLHRRVQAGSRADALGRPHGQFGGFSLGPLGDEPLYRWKREQLQSSGPVATSLEARVRELEIELHRVERERDILKKALAIFGRHE